MTTKLKSKKGKGKGEKKQLSIAQRAGYARRRLKNAGVESIKDHKDQDVPLDYVPDIKLVEHFTTLELIEEAKEIRQRIREFKYKVQTQGDDIYTQMLKDAGVDAGDIKNFSLSTMNKQKLVRFKRPPAYTQDEKQLEISRSFKRKFFEDMAGDVPDYIVDLIEELMENSQGDIDQAKISKLNQLATKIKNKNFRQMVEHYNQSLDAYYAKRYEQFIEKDDQGEDSSIILTYASEHPVNPEEDA